MVNFERSVDAQITLHPSRPHASPVNVKHLEGGQDAWTAPLKTRSPTENSSITRDGFYPYQR